MNLERLQSVYFIGVGGIGMSAVARYFLAKGLQVGGYDRVKTALTSCLENEGAWIHYEDDVETIPQTFKNVETTLIVYTPAIPAVHQEMQYFKRGGFVMQKRAEVLGTLTRMHKGLCVAGTHGKTSTSAMAAHLLYDGGVGCNAFLGGITKNYQTNYLLSAHSDYVVIEADEFDRSFHHLSPFATVITSADPDHLDIYHTPKAYKEGFEYYTSLIQPGGFLIIQQEVDLTPKVKEGVTVYTYGKDKGDFYAQNIVIGGGKITFDFISPLENISQIELGVPIGVNIENGVAAMALAQIAGVPAEEIRKAMHNYKGVVRRFDFKIKTDKIVFLSDYAHHPQELKQSILSIKEVFAGRKVTGIFQPHLYSRTNDFYKEFAQSLQLLDEVILLDIYPAREEPIPGVSSKLIFDELPDTLPKCLVKKEELVEVIREKEKIDVLMLLGAGDADDYCPAIEEILRQKENI